MMHCYSFTQNMQGEGPTQAVELGTCSRADTISRTEWRGLIGKRWRVPSTHPKSEFAFNVKFTQHSLEPVYEATVLRKAISSQIDTEESGPEQEIRGARFVLIKTNK